jgi:hypothetical protein
MRWLPSIGTQVRIPMRFAYARMAKRWVVVQFDFPPMNNRHLIAIADI